MATFDRGHVDVGCLAAHSQLNRSQLSMPTNHATIQEGGFAHCG